MVLKNVDFWWLRDTSPCHFVSEEIRCKLGENIGSTVVLEVEIKEKMVLRNGAGGLC